MYQYSYIIYSYVEQVYLTSKYESVFGFIYKDEKVQITKNMLHTGFLGHP